VGIVPQRRIRCLPLELGRSRALPVDVKGTPSLRGPVRPGSRDGRCARSSRRVYRSMRAARIAHDYAVAPWHFLYLRPLPHGQGALRGTLSLKIWFGFVASLTPVAPPPPPLDVADSPA